MVNPGSPLDTWTSTETGRPTAPCKVAEATEASMADERSDCAWIYRPWTAVGRGPRVMPLRVLRDSDLGCIQMKLGPPVHR